MATISYSLNLPVELTRLCANACGFCPYPYTAHDPLLPITRIRKAIQRARRLGGTLVEFTCGDEPEVYPEIIQSLQYYGQHDFLSYLINGAKPAHFSPQSTPLPVRLDIGTRTQKDWTVLARHFSYARLLLTSLDPIVLSSEALAGSRTQIPESRLQSIIDAAQAGLSLTTGTMIGIGESKESREKTMKVLAALCRKTDHVQAVLLQAFRPHPATPM
ncbi:radical SAM protein, partial [bacterium]|nr:radical SAM protein [bacterium]